MTRTKKKFVEPFHVETWFERDRAQVTLYDGNGDTILEWWDEAVEEAIEDGFLDPHDYLDSATEYAKSLGIL